MANITKRFYHLFNYLGQWVFFSSLWKDSSNQIARSLSGSFILIIPYHITSRLLNPNYTTCGVNEHENMFVCLFPFCSYYAVPLIVIIVCYSKLALHVIRTSRTMAGHMEDTVRWWKQKPKFNWTFSFFFRELFIKFYKQNKNAWREW